MGMQQPEQEVDPLCLPLGLRIGPWRVVGFGGRGTYGTTYRVELVGHEEAGPFALKLAVYPGDERFAREAWVLSHTLSFHVPRLYAHGVWEHASGNYPYLVMQWVNGEPLYDWAARRNPTQRQALELMLQVTRALVATHAAGGVHRDVKGSNVLVRPADRWGFLTDFGASHYMGAATLTTKLLPPGTPAYRSPEAWAFLRAFLLHPTMHYRANACDDLFALGVMAYRLVTDQYPPSADPEEPEAQVWRVGGSGPLPPSAINPRAGAELDVIILRLLAVAPMERFQGKALAVAVSLEKALEQVRPEADGPLFGWAHAHSPGWRSPEAVRLYAERDAAARQQLERRGARPQARTAPALTRGRPSGLTRARRRAGVVASLGLALALLTGVGLYRAQEAARSASRMDSHGSERVAVGDNPISSRNAVLAAETRKAKVPGVGEPMPESPFPDQRRPPCNRFGEVELRGGCWYLLGGAKPPCKDDAYGWKGACYVPVIVSQRQPAAAPP